MQRHPILGAGSIVTGLAIGYEFVAVMTARGESFFDWTLIIPVYIIASFVGGGALLILGRRLGYLLTLIAWSSLGVLLVLFLVWPQSHDVTIGAALLALIGLAVLIGLFRKSPTSPTSYDSNLDAPRNFRFGSEGPMKIVTLKVAASIYAVEAAVFVAALIYSLFSAETNTDRAFYTVIIGGFAAACAIMARKSIAAARDGTLPNPSLVRWGIYVTCFVGGLGGRWSWLAMLLPFFLVLGAVHQKAANA